MRARFSREVKLLEGLEHPAIVRVTASGEEDGVPWFAMTLIDGPSLRARLNRGPLALDEVRAVFGRVLAALEHAHARGVVHRDLKPANVLLAAEGAVVADFGIARMADALAAGRTQLTDTAAVLGTVAYMSPEQRAGAALDHRSDLFSLGVMLYEALTGTLPQGAFAPPSALRPELGARLDAVVLRLLRPQPSDRFASAAQVGLALEGALAPARWPRRMALSAAAASVIAGAGRRLVGAARARRDARRQAGGGQRRPPPPVPAPATLNPPPLTPANRPRPAPVPQAASTLPEGLKSPAQAFEGKDIKGKSGDEPSKARLLRKPNPKAVKARFQKQ